MLEVLTLRSLIVLLLLVTIAVALYGRGVIVGRQRDCRRPVPALVIDDGE